MEEYDIRTEERIEERHPPPSDVVDNSLSFFGRRSAAKSAWLVTFTDLITLMLTFFVMLCSMGEPKEDAWEKVVTGLQEHLGKAGYEKTDDVAVQKIIKKVRNLEIESGHDLGYLISLLENQFHKAGLLDDVLLRDMGDRIIVSLPSSVVFEKGEIDINPKGQEILDILTTKLEAIENRIEIYGHTDPDPVQGGRFASNWELSLSRAASVAYFLGQHGYKRDIVVQGFAHGRYDELPAGMSAVRRNALARRIDLVIQQDKNRK